MRRQQPKPLATAQVWAGICLLVLSGLSACSALPPRKTQEISFSNPPQIGQLLPTRQRFFACNTTSGARYMASTGFLLAGCQQIKPQPEQPFRVISIQLIELAEGGMWQVELDTDGGKLWMPLPWHDWA